MRLAGPAVVIAACAVEASAEAPFSSLPIEPPEAAQRFSTLPVPPRRLSQAPLSSLPIEPPGAAPPLLSTLPVEPRRLSEGGGGAGNGRRRRRRRRDDDEEDAFCSPGELNSFPTEVLSSFNSCVAHLEQTADFHVAGAEVAIQAQCWCENSVAEVYENMGCCDHPRLHQWCDVECSPDCGSEAAEACIEACPAVCLEEHYAPTHCWDSCNEHDCIEQMLCITEHAKNRTDAGLMEPVCHDVDWQESQHTLDYQECVAEVPQRTHWNWMNAINHCICKSDLRNATLEHHCCEASWAGDVCDVSFCPDMAICETDEALQCAESCNEMCVNIQAPSAACSEKCLKDGGECSQYLFCPPPPAKPFDYLCASGEAPDDGGCCAEPHSFHNTCPFLCDSGTKLLLPHGAECVCQSCPTTQEEQLEKFEVEVREGGRYLAGGEKYLNEIVARVGLDGPTSTMLELLEQRNADMVEVFELYASNYFELLSHLQKVHFEYIEQIEEAAWRCKNDSDCDQNTDGDSGEGKSVIKIGALCAGVLVLCCCGACFAVYMSRAKRWSSRPAGNPPEIDGGGPYPYQGPCQDDNVVIGAPVGGPVGGGSAAAAGAAMGTPSPRAPEAAKKDPDAESNAAGNVVAMGHPVPGYSSDAEKVSP